MKFLMKVPLQIWFVLVTVIVVAGGAAFLSLSQQNEGESSQVKGGKVEGKTIIGEEHPLLGAAHISPGSPHEPYNSNPPTSGPHYGTTTANGVHDEVIADETVIHNLEHGHIWIAYRPDVSEETKEKLKEFVQGDDWKMVVAPRPQNDVPIALAAWGRTLKLADFDEAQIKKFRDAYRNRGPEKTPS